MITEEQIALIKLYSSGYAEILNYLNKIEGNELLSTRTIDFLHRLYENDVSLTINLDKPAYYKGIVVFIENLPIQWVQIYDDNACKNDCGIYLNGRNKELSIEKVVELIKGFYYESK